MVIYHTFILMPVLGQSHWSANYGCRFFELQFNNKQNLLLHYVVFTN